VPLRDDLIAAAAAKMTYIPNPRDHTKFVPITNFETNLGRFTFTSVSMVPHHIARLPHY
jgi:hypothetical protein